MGTCISKCKPKKSSPKVQDKLVITQQTPRIDPPTISPSEKSSTCSVSTNSSVFSKSPLSSSCSVSTDSFAFSKSPLSSTCSSSTSNSNEMVWENRHRSVPVKSVSVHHPAPEKSITVQNQPKHVNSSTPKKRSRSNSPILTRQKSFRREKEPHQIILPASRRNPASSSPSRIVHSRIPEIEKIHGYTAVPRRNMVSSSSPSRRFGSDVSVTNKKNYMISSSPSRRFGTEISDPRRNWNSPSPSRRFNGDIGREISRSTFTGEVGSKRNSLTMLSSSRNKENIRPSPLNNSIRKTETCTHRIDPRADQEMVLNQESGSLSMNDPHISLDCFIFL